MVIASGLMLLRPRFGIVLTGVVLLVSTVASVNALQGRGDLNRLVFNVSSGVMLDLVLGVALYGSARLVYVLDQLESARVDIAELAVGRERLRVSRDLHDLLGQSLSAVSLKGDLAIRLLDHNPPAARAEIQSLTEVARGALQGVREITRDEHTASLIAEIERAAALLRAAGIDATVDVDLPELPARKEAVLAWVVREGVTNVLRHSRAATCTIRAEHRDGWVRLEILNDGAGPSVAPGSGLVGLTERAAAASGSLTVARPYDDHFRVLVELPTVEAT
jgi:two-component system sensor histidine kinase DesK